MKRSKRGRLHAIKPLPPPPKDQRYWDPEGALQRRILFVVRRTPLWFLDIRWFAKTGRHTKGMDLVFPDPHKPAELLKECQMQRAIHLANGEQGKPCTCVWCGWRVVRDAVILPTIDAVHPAPEKERAYIEIDTSNTCPRCKLRRVVSGSQRCVVCIENGYT